MKWSNILKVALNSILRHRMRSVLTMLGIIIGVGAVIIMVSIGQGVQKQVESQIAGLGSNVLMIFPSATNQGGVSQAAGSRDVLTLDDVDKIKRDATLTANVSPIVRASAQTIGGIGNWSTTIQGVYASYLDIRDWQLATGEFFTDRDLSVRAKVCVIGKTVADNLFPGTDPVGEQLRIRSVPFKIVGVLTEKGQGANGQDQDDIVLAPATTVLDRLSGRRFIQQIVTSSISADQMQAAQVELTTLLREAHHIRPGDDDDFMIRSQTEIADAAASTTQVLTMFLASIAGVSLVVGGIGIMNIMLVSVTERTREIGIRMAIGARSSDVLIQFLVESVVLSVFGGIMGIVLGLGGAELISLVGNMATALNPPVIIAAFIFSAAIGIFFGFYPARKAAALKPIDALRYE
ncbi:MAG: ABC transporter permease [Bacteroidetes bacterium]|nr:ABC transporter permease [Bacteroidota bacterium]